jgi:hypothetical protein
LLSLFVYGALLFGGISRSCVCVHVCVCVCCGLGVAMFNWCFVWVCQVVSVLFSSSCSSLCVCVCCELGVAVLTGVCVGC